MSESDINALRQYIASVDSSTYKSNSVLKYNGREITYIEKDKMGLWDKILFFFRGFSCSSYHIANVLQGISTLHPADEADLNVAAIAKLILTNKKFYKKNTSSAKPSEQGAVLVKIEEITNRCSTIHSLAQWNRLEEEASSIASLWVDDPVLSSSIQLMSQTLLDKKAELTLLTEEFEQALQTSNISYTLKDMLTNIQLLSTDIRLLTKHVNNFNQLVDKLGDKAKNNLAIKNYLEIIREAIAVRRKELEKQSIVKPHSFIQDVGNGITNGGNSCYLNSIVQAIRFVKMTPSVDLKRVVHRTTAKEICEPLVQSMDFNNSEDIQNKISIANQQFHQKGFTDNTSNLAEIGRTLLPALEVRSALMQSTAVKACTGIDLFNKKDIQKKIAQAYTDLEGQGFKDRDLNFAQIVQALLQAIGNDSTIMKQISENTTTRMEVLAKVLIKNNNSEPEIEKALHNAIKLSPTNQLRTILQACPIEHSGLENVLLKAVSPDPILVQELKDRLETIHTELQSGAISAQEINVFRNTLIACGFLAGKYSQEDAQEACSKLFDFLNIPTFSYQHEGRDDINNMAIIEFSEDMATPLGIQEIVQKNFIFTELPETLPISLNRYTFTDVARKDQRRVPFQDTIEVLDAEGEKVKYELASVIIHAGNDPRGGHYYTYAKHGNEWYEFNDDIVSNRHMSSIQDNLEQNGYIYFYKKA